MDIHDFEAWVARRDPEWYDRSVEEIYALREVYSLENCLEKTIDVPKYILKMDMQQARLYAKQAQLSFF